LFFQIYVVIPVLETFEPTQRIIASAAMEERVHCMNVVDLTIGDVAERLVYSVVSMKKFL